MSPSDLRHRPAAGCWPRRCRMMRLALRRAAARRRVLRSRLAGRLLGAWPADVCCRVVCYTMMCSYFCWAHLFLFVAPWRMACRCGAAPSPAPRRSGGTRCASSRRRPPGPGRPLRRAAGLTIVITIIRTCVYIYIYTCIEREREILSNIINMLSC